jgi:hypothetical protein
MAIIKPNNNTLSSITALPAAISTGKVLQAVTASTQTQSSTTSGSFQATALTANITPSATSSKILILISYSHYAASGDSRVTIYRDSTNLFDSTKGKFSFANTDVVLGDSTLDSPNTTSQVTYTVYHNAAAGTSYFLPQADIEAKMAEMPTLEEQEEAKKNLKASAKAKLIAGQPLTEEEADTIVL